MLYMPGACRKVSPVQANLGHDLVYRLLRPLHAKYAIAPAILFGHTDFSTFISDSDQIADIPGLTKIIKDCSHYSAIDLDVKPINCQYRPMVDEILRAKIGVDFETAVAIQGYIRQLLETCKGGAQSTPLRANRARLRRDIVVRAQEIWKRTKLNHNDVVGLTNHPAATRVTLAKCIIVHARERWAPTSMLPTFLFPSRLLTSSALFSPCNPKAHWLEDPTLGLQTSRDICSLGPDWVNWNARAMLQNLVLFTGGVGVTIWVKAAEEWHLRRLKHDLYSGKYLNLEYGGLRLEKLQDVPTAANNRLDVIAKKLRIDSLFPIGTLTDHEKRMAVVCFNKIIRHRCAGCPVNNLLILPSGLKEIVQHHRKYHPSDFWLNDKWTIRG